MATGRRIIFVPFHVMRAFVNIPDEVSIFPVFYEVGEPFMTQTGAVVEQRGQFGMHSPVF